MKWNQLWPRERAEIVRLYESGTPVHEIAATVGCVESTVSRIARDEGCALRRGSKTPKVEAAAREVLNIGCTQGDAARRFGVSASDVSRAVKLLRETQEAA